MSIIRADSIKNRAGNGAPDFPNGLTVTGVVTSTSISQNITGDLTVSGNIGVGGTLTYEDVTNVDSIGIVTARAGVNLVGNDLNVGSNIKIGNASGIVTATSFSGSGANLTGITAGLFSGVALLQDQKSAGTHGGQPPNTSSYFERDLNTEVFDTGNFVSLSSNNFTLIAGTYLLQASIPAHRTNGSKALLYNITDGTTVAYSQVVYIRDAAVQGGHINLTCRFTIGSTKSFDIRQRVNNSDGEGLGHASGFDTEIYTQVLIYKEN